MGETVRTRIAPSPTGHLHIGTARTALFNELYARQHNGQFIVRIEDTDKARSQAEYETDLLSGLSWLGLTWDEGPDIGGNFKPYRQSERQQKYKEALEKLLSANKAYEDDGAIKLTVDQDEVVYQDLIRGEVKTPTKAWGGDFVIARSLDDPVFHLAVVVDDAAMDITHVIRGEDHVSNTARHILLQRALGLGTPQYAHIPLLLDVKRKKLSKRDGNGSLLSYRDLGYLPEAMLNYLALLGWNPGTSQELFNHEDLVAIFSLEKVQKGGAVFSMDKLTSLNKLYIRQLSRDKMFTLAQPFLEAANYDVHNEVYWKNIVALEQERIGKFSELTDALSYFRPDWAAEYSSDLLIWKKNDYAATLKILKKILAFLEKLANSDFELEILEKKLLNWIDESKLGRGDTLWPMRVALTGRDKSPGPFEVAAILGKNVTLQRINQAVDKLDI